MIIDGKKIARKIIDTLKQQPKPEKQLAAVFVGDDSASQSFLKQKQKIAEELNWNFHLYQFPESLTMGELIGKIKNICADKSVGGVLIQLPLPEKFSKEEVLTALDPGKDIDALLPSAKVSPLSVEVVKDVLLEANFVLDGKVVGVVGRGALIGRPIAEWLSGKCREVIIFHTKTDLSRLADCDLVVSGVGKAGLIKPEMLKNGAGVIDFGFDMAEGKIRGDFDPSSLVASRQSLAFYTPTPGGTGPILVAELFRNFYNLSNA